MAMHFEWQKWSSNNNVVVNGIKILFILKKESIDTREMTLTDINGFTMCDRN